MHWGSPQSVNDVALLFVKYIQNQISFLPWCDSQLDIESNVIRDKLISINSHGYLTINSQPAVDGLCSSDSVFGWGPKSGFVYQKAYLEFFVSPDNLDDLITKIENMPCITYYAVNKQVSFFIFSNSQRQGDMRTNTQTEGANAVTWGVFPGHEIVQPTIVERQSFIAWKVR